MPNVRSLRQALLIYTLLGFISVVAGLWLLIQTGFFTVISVALIWVSSRPGNTFFTMVGLAFTAIGLLLGAWAARELIKLPDYSAGKPVPESKARKW